jgi:transcriptional regulator with XRE-family HTH domain
MPVPRARVPHATPGAATVAATGQTPGLALLAATLRELRAEHGLTISALARRAAVDRRTVQRAERGELRPRPSLLAAFGYGLDPDAAAELHGRLATAAGPAIVTEAEAWRCYRGRRMAAGVQQGTVPLPVGWDRRMRLYMASCAMEGAARTLMDQAAPLVFRPDHLITTADGRRFDVLMAAHDALNAEAERLFADSGGMRFAGRYPPPYRRCRGDPLDVPVTAPETGDLPALRRWLGEWQVREGRREPRTRRERAIAETGARERAKLAAAGYPERVRFFPGLPPRERSPAVTRNPTA